LTTPVCHDECLSAIPSLRSNQISCGTPSIAIFSNPFSFLNVVHVLRRSALILPFFWSFTHFPCLAWVHQVSFFLFYCFEHLPHPLLFHSPFCFLDFLLPPPPPFASNAVFFCYPHLPLFPCFTAKFRFFVLRSRHPVLISLFFSSSNDLGFAPLSVESISSPLPGDAFRIINFFLPPTGLPKTFGHWEISHL